MMCNVSMIGDQFRDHLKDKWPQITPGIWQTTPSISRHEFDQLKREVAELKEALKQAKREDEEQGNPDCEMKNKIALLRKVADLVGVNLDDVLGR